MPAYEVTSPDGKTWEVTAPEGATQEEVLAYAKQQWSSKAPAPTKTDRFLKGLRDPIDGGAQLLTKVLPEGLVQAGNRANNWLADKTGLVGRLPEGGVNQQVQEAERAYQASRGPDAGMDWMRVAGNVVNPANLAIAARLPSAATFGGRVATGAAGGGASALLNPVASDDFWQEKAGQVGMGAVGGGVVPAAVGGVARMVSPKASMNPAVAALRQEGIRPTAGQVLGGAANRVEEKLMSVPVVGDSIARARTRAAEDLNVAAFNRALAPIGKTLPKGTTGREAVNFTEDALSDGYKQLLPNLTAKADQSFNQEIAQLRQMVNTGSMDPNAAKTFNRILQNDLLGKFKGQQALTGETLKAVESDLGAQVRRFAQSQDADQRLVGDALAEVQASLRRLLERSNPNQAQELKALNTGWANFKRVQKAASMVGAEDGNFSAAQLQSAVKAADRSKDKGAFARGSALMQDLSDPAKAVLGNKVPNSGTTDRLLVGSPFAALFEPTLAAGMLGGSLAYSAPAQNALVAMIANRPQLAQPIANALRRASPGLAPLGAQVGLNALNQ